MVIVMLVTAFLPLVFSLLAWSATADGPAQDQLHSRLRIDGGSAPAVAFGCMQPDLRFIDASLAARPACAWSATAGGSTAGGPD
jgi:hypothetical protein